MPDWVELPANSAVSKGKIRVGTEHASPGAITVQPLAREHAPAVARLHARRINEGFLVRLGERFLGELYLAIAAEPDAAVLVALNQTRVVGFCAYARDVAGLFRRLLRRRGWRLGLAALPRAFNPRILFKIIETLRYPAKQEGAKLPAAEILSIAVDDQMRGAGIGTMLIERALQLAQRDGQAEIKVLAGAALEGANRFYLKCGFEKRTQIFQHGEPLNVYVRRLEVAANP